MEYMIFIRLYQYIDILNALEKQFEEFMTIKDVDTNEDLIFVANVLHFERMLSSFKLLFVF